MDQESCENVSWIGAFDERLYRNLHALERLSGVVSLLVQRVEKLEAARDVESLSQQEPWVENLVQEVKMRLTEDPVFKEALVLKVNNDLHSASTPDTDKNSEPQLSQSAKEVRDKLQEEQSTYCGKPTPFEYTRKDYLLAMESWHAQAMMYKFAESAWDSSMFVFHNMISKADSTWLLFLFVVNAFLQVSLVWLVRVPFTDQSLNDEAVQSAQSWRTTIAHDSRWMDAMTSKSLARLVCSSTTPYMSSGYQQTLGDVLDYSPEQRYVETTLWHPKITGELVCMLCLILWWCTIYVELRDVAGCSAGLFFVPVCSRTEIMLLKPGDLDCFAIRAISKPRKVWCFCVLSLRFVICVSLLYIGTLFLVYTVALRDLLLNALALQFMIEVDDLIYTTMAPTSIKHFISCLEAIPKNRRVLYRTLGIERNIFGFIFFLPLCLVLSIPLVVDQGALTKQFREVICGGYLDFVFSRDPGGAIVAHPTHPGSTLPTGIGPHGFFTFRSSIEYERRAVQELIDYPNAVVKNPSGSLSDSAPDLFGSALGVEERPLIPIGERMMQLNPLCQDISDHSMVWPTSFIINFYRDHPVLNYDLLSGSRSCSDSSTLHYCNYDNELGSTMRRWCSRSCGCHEPNSSLILSKNNQGCPHSCSHGADYYAVIESAECQDSTVSSHDFQSYIAGLKSVRESYFNIQAWYDMFGSWIDNLERNGCAGHVLTNDEGTTFGDLCGATAFGLKPIHWVCPVTCMCNLPTTQPGEDQAVLCPKACG